VPDPIKSLGNAEKYTETKMILLEGGGNGVYYSMNLMKRRVIISKTELSVRNNIFIIYQWKKFFSDNFFKLFFGKVGRRLIGL
jgi:hypothetical protein